MRLAQLAWLLSAATLLVIAFFAPAPFYINLERTIQFERYENFMLDGNDSIVVPTSTVTLLSLQEFSAEVVSLNGEPIVQSDSFETQGHHAITIITDETSRIIFHSPADVGVYVESSGNDLSTVSNGESMLTVEYRDNSGSVFGKILAGVVGFIILCIALLMKPSEKEKREAA